MSAGGFYVTLAALVAITVQHFCWPIDRFADDRKVTPQHAVQRIPNGSRRTELTVVFTLLLLVAVPIAARLVVGPILWAWWYVRRTFWRHNRFSLGSLFVSFTIAALLIGMFAAFVRGAN